MVKAKSGVPRGYQAVMPYLRVGDAAAAIKFYKKAFGAKENYRLTMAGKIGHAELDVGGSVLMLSDEFPDAKAIGPKALKGTSVMLTLYVADVDKVVAKAVRAGARVRREVADQFYGDRMGQIEDPYGHVWSIQTRIEKVTPKDMQRRLNAMLQGDHPRAPARKPGRPAKAVPAPAAAARKPAAKRPAKAQAAAKASTKATARTVGVGRGRKARGS
ncbi:MAG: VOC family protein [Hyphomicrobiaceae bacterium]